MRIFKYGYFFGITPEGAMNQKYFILTTCIFRASLSPGCIRLLDSSMNVFNLEHTSRGARDTGSSLKHSCKDICSDGATLLSSSGYFQKWRVLSEKNIFYYQTLNVYYLWRYYKQVYSTKNKPQPIIIDRLPFNKHHLLHQFPNPLTSIKAVRNPRSST